VIRYRNAAPIINSLSDAAGYCLNYVSQEVDFGRYDNAGSGLQNCRRLLREGRKHCPADTTNIGKECIKPFDIQFQTADHLSYMIQAGRKK
jgi:hypothetical protein